MLLRRFGVKGFAVATAVAGGLASGVFVASPAAAVSCTHEPRGPVLEVDEYGRRYVEYGHRVVCTGPVNYTIRITLQEKINGSWYTLGQSSRSGVDDDPALYSSYQCVGSDNTTYRAIKDTNLNGSSGEMGRGSGVVLACS